jgi:hypothetical protein
VVVARVELVEQPQQAQVALAVVVAVRCQETVLLARSIQVVAVVVVLIIRVELAVLALLSLS